MNILSILSILIIFNEDCDDDSDDRGNTDVRQCNATVIQIVLASSTMFNHTVLIFTVLICLDASGHFTILLPTTSGSAMEATIAAIYSGQLTSEAKELLGGLGLLTNIHSIMYGSQVASYFNLPVPTLEEYLE